MNCRLSGIGESDHIHTCLTAQYYTLQLTRPGSQNKDKDNQSFHKPFKKTDIFSELKLKRQNMPSAAALHTASQKTQNCLFCGCAEHKLEPCPDHNVAEQHENLKRTGRCFMCLGPKHIAKFRQIKNVRYDLCERRHHNAMCGNREEPMPATTDNTEDVVSSFETHSMKIKPKSQHTVLLQTAKAHAVGPAGQKVVHSLLDGGSQRSFINENTVKALKLPGIRQETFTLHIFGSATLVTTEHNTLKLVLQNIWDKGQNQ